MVINSDRKANAAAANAAAQAQGQRLFSLFRSLLPFLLFYFYSFPSFFISFFFSSLFFPLSSHFSSYSQYLPSWLVYSPLSWDTSLRNIYFRSPSHPLFPFLLTHFPLSFSFLSKDRRLVVALFHLTLLSFSLLLSPPSLFPSLLLPSLSLPLPLPSTSLSPLNSPLCLLFLHFLIQLYTKEIKPKSQIRGYIKEQTGGRITG